MYKFACAYIAQQERYSSGSRQAHAAATQVQSLPWCCLILFLKEVIPL